MSHIDNRKNKFLVLGEGYTFGINESFGAPKKIFESILVNQNQYLHHNGDNSYLFVNRK